MKLSDYREFHPNAIYVTDGRTINAVLKKAAKILNVDARLTGLYRDTPLNSINYDSSAISYMALDGALQEVEHNGRKGFGLVFASGCFNPYLVSNN